MNRDTHKIPGNAQFPTYVQRYHTMNLGNTLRICSISCESDFPTYCGVWNCIYDYRTLLTDSFLIRT